MRPWSKFLLVAAGLLLATLQQAAAEDLTGNDLRDIRIGIAVTDLPSAG